MTAAADWIAKRRESLSLDEDRVQVVVSRRERVEMSRALDALEKVLEAIEGTDRDWTPYFDDNSAYAAGYRFAVEQVLNGVHRVITEALGVES